MDPRRHRSLLEDAGYDVDFVTNLVVTPGQRRWHADWDCWVVPYTATFEYFGEPVVVRIGWETQDEEGNPVER